MLKRFTVLCFILAITMTSVVVTAQIGPSVCDESTDLWGCECTVELRDLGGHCETVDVSALPIFDDPGAHGTHSWISTTWDDSKNLWKVVADVHHAPGSGVFRALTNGGDWPSREAVHEYVSILLGVPLDNNGVVKPFEYIQRGESHRYDPSSGSFLVDSGAFWVDLLRDENGDIKVNGLVTTFMFDPTIGDCAPEKTFVDHDIKKGAEFSAAQTANICQASWAHLCELEPGLNCTVNDPMPLMKAYSLTSARSVTGFSFETEYENSSHFECSNNECEFLGAIERLGSNPAILRIARVIADRFEIKNTYHYRGILNPGLTQNEVVHSRHLQTVSLPAIATPIEPAINSECALAKIFRHGEDLYVDTAVRMPLSVARQPDPLPQCYVDEIQE